MDISFYYKAGLEIRKRVDEKLKKDSLLLEITDPVEKNNIVARVLSNSDIGFDLEESLKNNDYETIDAIFDNSYVLSLLTVRDPRPESSSIQVENTVYTPNRKFYDSYLGFGADAHEYETNEKSGIPIFSVASEIKEGSIPEILPMLTTEQLNELQKPNSAYNYYEKAKKNQTQAQPGNEE